MYRQGHALQRRNASLGSRRSWWSAKPGSAVFFALSMGRPRGDEVTTGVLFGVGLLIAFNAPEAPPSEPPRPEIRIGVFSPIGKQTTQHGWGPMEKYLSETLPEYRFRLQVLGPDALRAGVDAGNLDFAVVQPVLYAELETRYGMTRIATRMRLGPRGQGLDRFAGLLVVRDERADLQGLEDLRGRSLGAVAAWAFGGYLMQKRHLLDAGINPDEEMTTTFLGLPQQRIVEAVLRGDVDVGCVRTGVLEAMTASGELDPKLIRILDAKPARDNFPFPHTTRDYPEFALAASPSLARDLTQKVGLAFLQLPPEHPAARATRVAGWMMPSEYRDVHELMRQLRYGPYVDYGRVTWRSVWEAYGPFLFAIAALVFGLVVLSGGLLRAFRIVRIQKTSLNLILDSVGLGIVRLTSSGQIYPEYSAKTKEWLGSIQDFEAFGSALGRFDPTAGEMLNLSLEVLAEGVYPYEILSHLFPSQATGPGRRTLHLSYRPLVDGGLLVILEDETEMKALEAAEREQRELASALRFAIRDPGALADFVESTNAQLGLLESERHALVEKRRALHTLKGNAAVLGFDSIAELCHDLEAVEGEFTADGLAPLRARWMALRDGLEGFLGTRQAGSVQIAIKEHHALLAGLMGGADRTRLAGLVESYRLERADLRLERLRIQAIILARRLGKGDIEVQLESIPLRFDIRQWGEFWNAMVHVIRNALDHGLESPSQRQGKGPGRLWLSLRRLGRTLELRVQDDGRGVDFESVRERARQRGLPHETRRHLIDALFHDGLTTRAESTAVSGRGLGLAAVASSARGLGGRIDIVSEPGQGTEVVFRFPCEAPGLVMSAPSFGTIDLEESLPAAGMIPHPSDPPGWGGRREGDR